MAAHAHRGDRPWERWRDLARAVSWTPPTSTEVGVVIKSGLAAGLSWLVAESVTDVPAPVLAPLTAIVVVQVSVRASIMSAVQRSAAVVLGVLLAIAIGDALGLNALTVAAVVVASLGFAELVLRLPRPAARQVPISALVVLAALSVAPATTGWWRALDTVIGAAVGVAVSFVLPASRLVDARQTLDRLGTSIAGALESMGHGLRQEWSVEQTEDWRQPGAHDTGAPRASSGRGRRQQSRGLAVERPRPPPRRGSRPLRGGAPATRAHGDRRLGHLPWPRRPCPPLGYQSSADGIDGGAARVARRCREGPGRRRARRAGRGRSRWRTRHGARTPRPVRPRRVADAPGSPSSRGRARRPTPSRANG